MIEKEAGCCAEAVDFSDFSREKVWYLQSKANLSRKVIDLPLSGDNSSYYGKSG